MEKKMSFEPDGKTRWNNPISNSQFLHFFSAGVQVCYVNDNNITFELILCNIMAADLTTYHPIRKCGVLPCRSSCNVVSPAYCINNILRGNIGNWGYLRLKLLEFTTIWYCKTSCYLNLMLFSLDTVWYITQLCLALSY